MKIESNRIMFDRMPGGNMVDYDRIFNAIDDEFGTKKIEYKKAERYLNQYRDAMRNYGFALDRYEFVTEPLSTSEAMMIRDPTARIIQMERKSTEFPTITKIHSVTQNDRAAALNNASRLIHYLTDDTQRLIMTAHYVCLSDWKHISKVCGHQDRWAKDLHIAAMRTINDVLVSGFDEGHDEAACMEIEKLTYKWAAMEYEYRKKEERERRERTKIDFLRVILPIKKIQNNSLSFLIGSGEGDAE